MSAANKFGYNGIFVSLTQYIYAQQLRLPCSVTLEKVGR